MAHASTAHKAGRLRSKLFVKEKLDEFFKGLLSLSNDLPAPPVPTSFSLKRHQMGP